MPFVYDNARSYGDPCAECGKRVGQHVRGRPYFCSIACGFRFGVAMAQKGFRKTPRGVLPVAPEKERSEPWREEE
jgi:hypothetical protein